MNSRLAQIVASSIGPDGKPDRAKIFAELQLTPDAPETLLIDAFLGAEEGIRALRAVSEKSRVELVATIRNELAALDVAFAAHARAVTDAGKQIEALHIAGVEARQKWEEEITKHATAVVVATKGVVAVAGELQAAQVATNAEWGRAVEAIIAAQNGFAIAARHLTGRVVGFAIVGALSIGLLAGVGLALFVIFPRLAAIAHQ